MVKYRRHRQAFQDWRREAGKAANSPVMLDRALAEYLDHLYLEGQAVEAAEQTVSAEKFFNKRAVPFPESAMALQSFR